LFVESLFGNFDIFVDFVVNIASSFLDGEKRIRFFVILLFSEFSVITLTGAGSNGQTNEGKSSSCNILNFSFGLISAGGGTSEENNFISSGRCVGLEGRVFFV